MKTKLILCGTVMLSLFGLHAQTDTTGLKPPFFNQVSVSLNYSDAQWYERGENRTSFGAGIYQNTREINCFQLRWGFELNRIRQIGVTPNSLAGFVDAPFQSTITALSLPVVLKYSFGKNIKWVPETGFYMEHNMSNRLTGNYTQLIGDSANLIETKLSYNRIGAVAAINYGASVGLGAVIPSGPYSYEFKADYRFGAKDIGSGSYNSPLYARYFRFSAGIIFHEKANNISANTGNESAPWFNEFTVSGNYNDISRYSMNDDRGGFGFGIYHNSRVRRGFSTNVGLELNNTNYYGRLVPNHKQNLSWYSDMDASMTAITVPFVLRYHIGKKFSVFPEAGVFLDINSNAKGRGKSYGYSGTPPNVDVIESEFNGSFAIQRLNQGVTAGLGFLIPIGENSLLLKAEYRYGLHELTPEYYSSSAIYNRYFRFSAGYSLARRNFQTDKPPKYFFNEFRASINYFNLRKVSNIFPSYESNEQGSLGYGMSIYHTSAERNNFQYLLGIDFDLTRGSSDRSDTYAYETFLQTTRTESKYQWLTMSINNGLRYYIGNQRIRPFVQIGIAPGFLFLTNTKRHITTTYSNTDDNIESISYNTKRSLGLLSIGPNAGIGFTMQFNKVDYLLLLDYRLTGDAFNRNYLMNSNLFRLSLGVRLHRLK